MTELPSRAQAVVIGAGIVGNCLVGHLSRLGWTDMVLLDKGPLPNPGGSTGHASNFIFPTDHNKEMALLTLASQAQYEAMGVNTTCGGIEVARTPERLEEFKRRMTSAKAWGIEASLLTPAEIKELVPFINEEILLGGFNSPTVSVVDSLRAGTLMREEAVDAGHLQVFANTEVLDVEVSDGVVRAVVTDKGRIEADHVVIACGVWSPRIAAMAGATIPLTPAVHQMADVGPIDVLVESGKELAYPIVRDMDTFMYERQSAGSMEVGSYAHRPIFHRPDDIPSNDEAALSPTELPFTDEDFDDQLEDALEIMGEILETAEIRYAINGLLSLTPDAMPVLGETVEVRNLWSAAAVWIKEGPGIAQLVAEWMTYGYPHLCDGHSSDITRFYPHERPCITSRRAARSTSTRPTGSCTRASSGRPSAACGARRSGRARRRSARCSSTPAAGSGRSGTSRTRRCSTSSPASASARAARVGRALVVADHERRAPRAAVTRRDGGPHRVLRVRHHRPGRARRAAVPHRELGERARSVARCTRRCSRPTAGSAPTSRSCASARSTSAWSPARSTAAATSTGSASTCPTTAR